MEYTPVHNRFWSDGWVRGLNALDRYLFLYLLTNGRAKLTGIYELPLDLMASESGIDQRDLQVMLVRLEPKIYYREGWVILTNYLKHHIGGGHKFGQGVKAQFNEIPSKIRDLAKGYGYPIDTLYMEYPHFPNRREENIRNAFAPQNTSSEITRVNTTTEGEEKPPKKEKYARRGSPVWELREELYSMLKADTGHQPTQHTGDYMQIDAALKAGLSEKDVVEMFEEAIADGGVRTVREVFTARKIDIYKQDNL